VKHPCSYLGYSNTFLQGIYFAKKLKMISVVRCGCSGPHLGTKIYH